MRTFVNDSTSRLRSTFAQMTVAQRVTAVVGAAVLLVGAFLLYRWAAAPDYQQLYGNLESADAAAIVEQLETDGVPYELTDGGTTIMVPSDRVYDERIKLSGAGLPSDGSDGYSLLDEQDLSSSQFQERTSYKRAIEGELASTIEALDGVNTAVVHVAMPEETVFSDEQDLTKASVLVDTTPGVTLESGQVQAILSLVSSSVEGLDPDQVTVTDAEGQVLSAGGEGGAGAGGTQAEQVQAFEQRQAAAAQSMLDRILGPGNATVTVTAEMDFGQSETRERTYLTDPDAAPLSERETTEEYTGMGDGQADGVVGPDGELGGEDGDGDGDEPGSYLRTDTAQDNAVGERETYTVTAPGGVTQVAVSAALDTQALQGRDPQDIQELLVAGLGLNERQGDSVAVADLPFDRTAEEAAAADLAAAQEAEASAAMWSTVRTGVLAGVVALLLLGVWLSSRRRAKRRADTTRYVVEQIRADSAERTALVSGSGALALDGGTRPDDDPDATARREIEMLVDRQPDEVAQLLRGWLADRRVDA